MVPSGFGEDEFIEKKSRFIGRIWQVETEEEALARIQEMKKQHYDATHNCWVYRSLNTLRASKTSSLTDCELPVAKAIISSS